MPATCHTGRISAALLGALGFLGLGAIARGDPVAHESNHASTPTAARTSASLDLHRSVTQYALPRVTLTREDGKRVDLATELNDGRPVVLNFIYTSCTTICPMSSEVFEQFQDKLGAARESVHLVSISIDPEQDTPARLRAYAAQFHAGKGWNHYSGNVESSVLVQRVFNAYRGDKMAHVPLTLVREAPGKPWVRFDGFANSEDLLAERNSWSVLEQAKLVAR
jgi:protein SCO1